MPLCKKCGVEISEQLFNNNNGMCSDCNRVRSTLSVKKIMNVKKTKKIPSVKKSKKVKRVKKS